MNRVKDKFVETSKKGRAEFAGWKFQMQIRGWLKKRSLVCHSVDDTKVLGERVLGAGGDTSMAHKSVGGIQTRSSEHSRLNGMHLVSWGRLPVSPHPQEKEP